MQRCFFFIFLLWGCFAIPAQGIDILKTELSLWLADGTQHADAIRATARLDISVDKATDEILLYASDLLITSIRKSEGRLKETFVFTHRNDTLSIRGLKLKSGSEISLFFDYYILPSINSKDNFLLEPNKLVVLNPDNLRTGHFKNGLAGSFYPSLPLDASELLVDVSLPEHYKSKIPGDMEFQTDNQDGSYSHYWRSARPLAPEEFYLMAGDFERLRGASLDAYLTDQENQVLAQRATQLQHYLDPVLSYLNINDKLKDEELVAIDRLSRNPLNGFYLEAADVHSSPYAFQLEKASFLYHFNLDTAQASHGHLEYYLQICGTDWTLDLLDRHWQSFEQERPTEQETTIMLAERIWFQQNDWTNKLDSSRAHKRLWQPMQNSREPPVLRVEYSYRYTDKAQYIQFIQDTALAPTYEFPIEILSVLNGDSTYSVHWLTGAAGALVLEFSTAPQYVEASFGAYFPGMVMERRPESHYLYQMSNTTDDLEKRRALQLLFNTENANLFSTVLGIALRDPDPNMRAAALNRVDQLNATGLLKVRPSLVELSTTDPDSANRSLAQVIVEKHYGSK